MRSRQIHDFLLRFCEATGCELHEQTERYLSVRLSADVDRVLTNRPYYWLFVDRTGALAETLKMRWLFGSEEEKSTGKAPVTVDSVRATTPVADRFAFVPRIPELDCRFGGIGLQQMFRFLSDNGRHVCLFERPSPETMRPRAATTYHSWVCFQVKVEYVCDVKREELHSLGVHLQSGKLLPDFLATLLAPGAPGTRLQAQLPPQTQLARARYSPEQAWELALQYVHTHLRAQDTHWHEDALRRRDAEHQLHEAFVAQLPEESREQHPRAVRTTEIDRQYSPRIRIVVLGCGLFHLNPASNISPAV